MSLPLGREMNYIWNSICLGRASDEKGFPAQGRSDCHFATQRTIVARSPCTARLSRASNDDKPHTVTLTWKASPSHVSGYNVYANRSPKPTTEKLIPLSSQGSNI